MKTYTLIEYLPDCYDSWKEERTGSYLNIKEFQDKEELIEYWVNTKFENYIIENRVNKGCLEFTLLINGEQDGDETWQEVNEINGDVRNKFIKLSNDQEERLKKEREKAKLEKEKKLAEEAVWKAGAKQREIEAAKSLLKAEGITQL